MLLSKAIQIKNASLSQLLKAPIILGNNLFLNNACNQRANILKSGSIFLHMQQNLDKLFSDPFMLKPKIDLILKKIFQTFFQIYFKIIIIINLTIFIKY